ncbi:MAG: DUF4010 domain-containing protein, partial [Anaerolineales bacterium]|nr:DUF4010 domain-containing protein [Anaerolineales bacterium]
LIYALFLFFSQSAIDEEELSLSNPFELGTAIKFGLIYALVLLKSKLLRFILALEVSMSPASLPVWRMLTP